MRQHPSGGSCGVKVGRSSKGALGHPTHTLVITSDLPADPAGQGGDTGTFSGSQTHRIED